MKILRMGGGGRIANKTRHEYDRSTKYVRIFGGFSSCGDLYAYILACFHQHESLALIDF